jgi:hypothetical protein
MNIHVVPEAVAQARDVSDLTPEEVACLIEESGSAVVIGVFRPAIPRSRGEHISCAGLTKTCPSTSRSSASRARWRASRQSRPCDAARRKGRRNMRLAEIGHYEHDK